MDSFSPRLTTIDLPKRGLGAAAAQLLVERIAKGKGRARIIKLKNALRVRESCGCGLIAQRRTGSPKGLRCGKQALAR